MGMGVCRGMTGGERGWGGCFVLILGRRRGRVEGLRMGWR